MNKKVEIIEIVKDIQDIDKQIRAEYPSIEQLQNINIKAKAKFPKETSEYEIANSLISGNSTMTPINVAPANILLNRLPFYRNLYINELRKKCDEEEYFEILKEHKI